jgi:hypothetical protein
MYNENLPSKDELPSSKQLIKSTLLALLVAMVILVTVVLPAEYAIDPTGAGRWLGLADMGEIKQQLSEEAEADRVLALTQEKLAKSVKQLEAETKTVTAEQADKAQLKPEGEDDQSVLESTTQPEQPAWKDEIQFVIAPGQGTEYKLLMNGGAVAQYFWISEGGPINFDAHGDGLVGGKENGQRRSISYEKGRGVTEDQGDLTAAFSGKHGWFFRNRNKHNVTVTLKVKGDYSALKKMI